MPAYRVGIIGCGKPWKSEGATGFGMSHAHAQGYSASTDTAIVALADINLDNARAFQEKNGGDKLYEDYHQMLARESLDIVSISTWPHLHAEMVNAAAQAGVKAIHCEKPMAPTFGECRAMVDACEANNVQLTFNHQRRFGTPFRKAKALLDSGVIGDLVRVEGTCPDLFDWGTHWFDMMFMYNNEMPAEWVIGQIDIRNHRVVFGITLEGHGISQIQFQNGVTGLLMTGTGSQNGMGNRLIGTEGMIDVGHSEEIPLRMFNAESGGWQAVAVDSGIHGMELVKLGVLDMIDALKTGREPELSGQRALRATEVIFATYESSRRRARVDLPLLIDDSPLHAMIDSGDIITIDTD